MSETETEAEAGLLRTGLVLLVGDAIAKLEQVYGHPDSKSPSTRNGQPLELWYYAFDWPGKDVPQGMVVRCTREAHGKQGRVVEIMLAGRGCEARPLFRKVLVTQRLKARLQ